jgi:penicillin-binding protein 1A
MQPRAARPRTGPRGFVILGGLLLALLAVLLVGALVLGALTLWWAHELPPIDKATDYRPRQHLQVLSADGVEIAQFGAERRLFVPVAQVPQRLKDAVLAVEDAGFYEHGGISWRGLARAVVANLSGGVPQGASTITQQVARTFFLSTRRTAERKVKEALLAIQLERELSKDEILELYLNQIFLGRRAYGFGAAAATYFGKPLPQLTLAETALLAGLPQNPFYANPLASPERATRRMRWVLQRMVATGKITEAQRQEALAQKLVFRNGLHPDVDAQHVAEMARKAVVERLGEQAYTEGVRVYTSLHAQSQRAAHDAVRRALLNHERKQPWRGPEEQDDLPAEGAPPEAVERAAALALRDVRDDDDLRAAIVLAASPREVRARLATGEEVLVTGEGLRAQRGVAAALAPKAGAGVAIRRGSVVRLVPLPGRPAGAGAWAIAQWPQAEAAYVALDPATGRIRALVGGFDFGRNQFNRATSAWRQPGSSFKPFLYSAAFNAGVMPETTVDDAPLTAPDGGVPSWNPQNSDGRFAGPISVREAIVLSKNLPSVRLLQHVGLGPARAWAQRFGFEPDKLPDNLTFALGAGSTTPLQLARAYAVLANGGHRVEPVLIERIVDARGQVLFEAPPPVGLSEASRVVPENNVFLVDTLLRDVTARGTAARAQAQLGRSDLYGKTGTTNDAVDAWFAGFHASLVGVAWMGYDDPQSLGEGESGGGLALPIWIDAMARALRGVPASPLAPPAGVVAVGGDWRLAPYEHGGFLAHIGDPLPLVPAAPASAPDAGEAASVPR